MKVAQLGMKSLSTLKMMSARAAVKYLSNQGVLVKYADLIHYMTKLIKIWNHLCGRKTHIGYNVYTYADGKHDDSKYIQKVIDLSGGVKLPNGIYSMKGIVTGGKIHG